MTQTAPITLPTVDLGGPEPVTMRHLGLEDLGHLATIVRASQESWLEDQNWRINPTPWATTSGLATFLLVGLPRAGAAATPWVGSLIGLTPEESRDPSKLSLTVLSQVLEALVVHPDLRSLQAALGRIWTGESFRPIREAMRRGTEQ